MTEEPTAGGEETLEEETNRLVAIRRAGADAILTYFARAAARWLA